MTVCQVCGVPVAASDVHDSERAGEVCPDCCPDCEAWGLWLDRRPQYRPIPGVWRWGPYEIVHDVNRVDTGHQVAFDEHTWWALHRDGTYLAMVGRSPIPLLQAIRARALGNER